MGKDTRIDRIDRALNFVARGDWVERQLIRFGNEMPVFGCSEAEIPTGRVGRSYDL